jgi:hypothetical protein
MFHIPTRESVRRLRTEQVGPRSAPGDPAAGPRAPSRLSDGRWRSPHRAVYVAVTSTRSDAPGPHVRASHRRSVTVFGGGPENLAFKPLTDGPPKKQVRSSRGLGPAVSLVVGAKSEPTDSRLRLAPPVSPLIALSTGDAPDLRKRSGASPRTSSCGVSYRNGSAALLATKMPLNSRLLFSELAATAAMMMMMITNSTKRTRPMIPMMSAAFAMPLFPMGLVLA